MAITVQTVLTRVVAQLTDPSNIRWTQAELLDYLNEGQRLAANLKPDLVSTTIDVALATGTRQTIPTDGFQLLDIMCNVDAINGNELSAPRVCTRSSLDNQNSSWRSQKYANPTVRNYVFDGLDPKAFYVTPPQPATGTGFLRILYAKTPTVLVNTTDTLSLPDVLDSAMVDYVLFRAYNKDTEADGYAELAQAAYQRFASAIGIKEASERKDDPNQGMTGLHAASTPASNK